jgi:hypothetical protein
MDEKTLETLLERAGLAVDDGGTIGSPFIPDGTVRVYDPDTLRVLGRGDTLTEAFADTNLEDT